MKNKAFQILCIFCIILSLSNCSKEKNQNIIHVNKNAETLLENEFIIRGTTFSNNLNNAYIYKVESDTLSLLDTIVIKEKAFTYKGIAKQPEFYAIKVDASDINYKFLVDASEINMFLNTNLFLSSTSSNSEVQKVYAS
ncbi:uncharacterized protein DUF4369 [Oceanihabitans sediminis]|uniref:DUF4369 domain-containing protein n=3 Tax=Oceanihabitans sediminis TaxID=1812012 RepID=A0A368P846_9FLAO|nr:DUF4369 domain-containing protein [Oceanihabitans sediminis]RBP33088.1 uncharacterized protein DUF4369 [Oceanihabitans sediminis]RCU57401.1 DUF4369 domain-containing protein [Oceanihabitans sediminis]